MYDIQCYEGDKVILEVVAKDYYRGAPESTRLKVELPNGQEVLVTFPYCIIKEKPTSK